MAEIKISELTANGANLQTTDRIPTAVDDGLGGFVTRYVTGDEVIGAVSKTTVPVRNQSGATIYKGSIVYISSATGGKLLISKSRANSESTSARTLGVVTADIANNTNGNVQTSGILTNLDTRSSATNPFTSVTLAEGDTLYLDPTTAGYITNVKPLAPSHLVYIGKVINASPTTGEILYQVQNGYELDEIHDVAIASVANNDLIQYDSATSLWKNRTLSTAGIQPTLVSGTNIKTINSTSILGSGNIAISSGLTVGTTAITSGTVGRVLFEGTGNLVQEDAALFWDNTNKKLGIGATPDTSTVLDVRSSGALSTDIAFRVRNSANTKNIFKIQGDANAALGELTDAGTKTFSVNTYNNPRFVLGTGYSTDTGVISITRRQGGVLTDNTLLLSQNSFVDGNQVPYKHQYVNPSNYYGTNVPSYGYNAGFMYFRDSAVIANLQMKLSPDNALNIYSSAALPIETNFVDAFQLYSRDIVAGNAAPHFRTENGNIIKLYQQPTGGSASTFVTNTSAILNDSATFDGYTIGQVVKALRNLGILA